MLRRFLTVCIASAVAAVVFADEPVSLTLTAAPIANPERIVTGPARLAVGSTGSIPIPEMGLKFDAAGDSKDITLAGQKVTITWKSADQFTVTAGGKPQPLHTIPKGYGMLPAEIKLDGGRAYVLAFPVAQVGQAGDGMRAAVFYRSGSAQTGTIDGETVWIYDRNTDGTYSRDGDSIRIGPAAKVPVFAPIRQNYATPNGIYRVEDLAADGSSLKYSKYTGPTGKVQVVFSGSGSEAKLILVSADGKTSAVAEGAEKSPELPLPPDRYTATYAIVETPASGRINAVIVPTSLPAIEIADGQTQKLDLGGPYRLDFKIESNGTTFKIDPASLVVSGKSGETYIQYRWAQRPDVSVSSGAAPRRLGKMPLGGTNGLTEYSGALSGAKEKIILAGMIEGLGAVKGEVAVP